MGSLHHVHTFFSVKDEMGFCLVLLLSLLVSGWCLRHDNSKRVTTFLTNNDLFRKTKKRDDETQYYDRMMQKWNAESYDGSHSFVTNLGMNVVEQLLNPRRHERILDVGCGTGHLSAQIAQLSGGAKVIGLDSSDAMLHVARHNYPHMDWRLGDARTFQFHNETFDAVFTNAALHWIPEPTLVASNIFHHLKEDGRFVGEFGGYGNVATLYNALDVAARSRGLLPLYETATTQSNMYFPSISHWSTVLKNAGFRVQTVQLLDRPTPLEGQDGAYHWLRQFCAYYLDQWNEEGEAVARDAQEIARAHLYRDGQWWADYRRIRFLAVKPSKKSHSIVS